MELDEARDWVEESEYIADDGEYRPAFVVDSDTKAAWAMRKYHAALDKMARADELAEIEERRIADWITERRRIIGRDVDFFGMLLSNYALDQREQFDRKKVDLPDGVVQTRTVSDRFKVEDKDIFVEWALKNAPELLKVSYAPNMSAVSERCLMAGDGAVEEDTGAVVPGVKVEPGRVSASIKVN